MKIAPLGGSPTKPELYRDLTLSVSALIEGEPDPIANLANASALLAQALDRINWCGFYLLRGEELVLGPFQGKPACVRIAVGRGVCGTAAAAKRTLVVPNVDAFPGHIACDPASRSEIVVPILQDGALRGILDVDSAELDRFDDEDRRGLETFANSLAGAVDWTAV